jgi:hypothetical protein
MENNTKVSGNDVQKYIFEVTCRIRISYTQFSDKFLAERGCSILDQEGKNNYKKRVILVLESLFSEL